MPGSPGSASLPGKEKALFTQVLDTWYTCRVGKAVMRTGAAGAAGAGLPWVAPPVSNTWYGLPSQIIDSGCGRIVRSRS